MARDRDRPPTGADSDSDTVDALSAFVPRLAVELGRGPVPSWTSVEGSMLSADISGFTALSEKLAGRGKAGAEEITSLINTCFTALIESAYRYGGEVIKFGGDALLILFRGEHHERRAADTGVLMQRALHSSSAAKRANLTMTVGIAAGPFDVFLVGSGYRELLITGPRATEVIRLEGEAAKGDTLVDPLIAEHLPNDMKLREEHGGWVIIGSTGDEPSGPRERRLGDDDLSPYVPAAVVEQLAAFSGTGGEHRLVTVGFLMVGGVEALLEREGPDAVAGAFHRLVDDVERICATFGVTPLHTDIAPDGIKFVLCAGAPVNPGDTSDALLHAALQLAALDSPFVLRQGVQTGRVFAGFLGSDFRRTYTLMGDPVNTAARMLGKATDRDIVAVADVVDGTRAIFLAEALKPFLVKGKSEPISAYIVLAATDEVRRDTVSTRLHGRAAELDVLTRAIGELGEVVILRGSAGVGKSRLLYAAHAVADGLQLFHGTCTPYGAMSPYSVFRPLLRAGSGIDLNADPLHAGELLEKIVVQSAPHLEPWLPLLAVPFGAHVASSPEVDAIDPQFRRARTHDVVVDFLDTVLEGPVFLVVEDLHWIDDVSGELLNHLVAAAATRPWTAALTRRPEGSWQPPDGSPHVREIDLHPLTDDDIRSLALEVADRPFSDAELSLIVQRSGGNPLFTIELARAVSRGMLDHLPESIEGLIATRIDALPAQQRRLLRVAAVFGREFDVLQVSAVADDDLTVTTGLEEMIERTDASHFRFRHAMYRDAAYEGLPYRERKRLHERTAAVLEADHDRPEQIASLLSLHFAAARLHREAFRYARLAADEAAAVFSHGDAIEQYERALAAGRYCSDVTAADRCELLVGLGRSKEFHGDLVGAEAAYRRVCELTDDVDLAVDCLRRRARVRQKQNRLTDAIRLLRRGERLLDASAGQEFSGRRLAEIHLNLAGIRTDQGRLGEARREAEEAMRCAVVAGDDALRVQSYGAIVGSLSEWAEAEPYAELGFGPDAPADAYEARSILAINLGMCAFFAGRWVEAVEYYELGRSNAFAIGNVSGAALASMNAAEVLIDQGHIDAAADALVEIRRILRAAGYNAALSYADLLYAVAQMRMGRIEESVVELERIAAEFRAGSMAMYAFETELRLAEAHLRAGRLDRSREIAQRVRDDAVTLSRYGVVEVRALRILGRLAMLEDDLERAVGDLRTAVEICRAEDLQFELALTLVPLATCTDDDALLAEAEKIFDELGVTRAGRFLPADLEALTESS
jgi:class 3 adenylate cyclase/tetratricopeptide (TPR) repeat protein